MLYSSPIFLFLFLPLVLGAYYLCPRTARNLLLVEASLLFYAWGEPSLVVVMLVSMAMNYGLGQWVGALRGGPAARWIVGLAVAANLGILVYFKYASFLVESLNVALEACSIPMLAWPNVTMPIGISFYTFHAISYVVDIYRGKATPERNPINVALYILLFPQLIAGPIIRYLDVAEQIRERRVIFDDFAAGVQRFLVGLGKKMLIANPLATVADGIFDISAGELSTPVAWLGIVCYTLQIYFDFSGYSDMAIGLGWMFGFRFLENFNYPYTAQTVTDFWRRWHISLSTWFRDYLYIPLGGNRVGPWRQYFNLFVVMFLCGFWHGASWTFIVWGLFHGSLLILERGRLGTWLARVPRVLRHAWLMLVVMIGWVFFRADTLSYATTYLRALAGFGALDQQTYNVGLWLDSGLAIALCAGLIGSTPWLKAVVAWNAARPVRPAAWQTVTRGGMALGQAAGLVLVLLASAATMLAGTYNPFIYFRF